MKERMVYLSGEWVPESAAKVSIFDRGFTLGDAIYESIRTFRHRPFKVAEHMERLFNSLRVARIDPRLSPTQIEKVIYEVAEINAPLFDDDDDFWIYPTISRGVGGHPLRCGAPTVAVAVKPINWGEHAKFYREGAHVVTPSIRKQPPECYDAKVKSTSRFHHTLADIEAAQVDPESYCLLLDLDGNVAENRSSNFCIVRKGTVETPSSKNCLRGITVQLVFELARTLNIPAVEKEIQLYDVYNADEAFLTATSFCLLPVSRLNGMRICQEQIPGQVTGRLLQAFSELAGLDVIEQSMRRWEKARAKK